MNTTLVPIPTNQITDWPSFHEVFAEALGFPSFYGKNMNAWNYGDSALIARFGLRPNKKCTVTEIQWGGAGSNQ